MDQIEARRVKAKTSSTCPTRPDGVARSLVMPDDGVGVPSRPRLAALRLARASAAGFLQTMTR